jgi:hypothetical protein
VKNLIQQNKLIEAYLLACKPGVELDIEDRIILQASVEGYDCITNEDVTKFLVKIGNFNDPIKKDEETEQSN